MNNKLQQQLECEICLQSETDFYIVCKYQHSFCWYCSERFISTCPKCRLPLQQLQRDHIRNYIIQNLLYDFCVGLKKNYHQDVDVLDCDGNWCRAKIINYNKNCFKVHYYGWGDQWNEWIYCFSGRIMPVNTYTEDWIETIHIGKNIEFLLMKNNMRRWHNGTITKIFPSKRNIMVISKTTTSKKEFKIKLDRENIAPLGTHTPLNLS